MKKYLTPGILWLAYLIISISLIFNKSSSDRANLFKFSWSYIMLLLVFVLLSVYTYYYDKPKFQATSIVSFLFGLMVFIPLLNLIFAIPAVYFGINSIKKIKQNPQQYGGKWFAIIGIIFGALVYATYLTGLGMCLYGYKNICNNIGLTFLAK